MVDTLYINKGIFRYKQKTKLPEGIYLIINKFDFPLTEILIGNDQRFSLIINDLDKKNPIKVRGCKETSNYIKMMAQEHLRYEEMAALARHCKLCAEDDAEDFAADKLIEALKDLLEKCGLETGCAPLKEKDYDRLTHMIDADSVNYSPSITFSDNEIRILLDQIRRGY